MALARQPDGSPSGRFLGPAIFVTPMLAAVLLELRRGERVHPVYR